MRAFFFLALLASAPASAQISCIAKPGTTPTIEKNRCDGYVRVQLICTGTTTPDSIPVPVLDFEVTANVPITNDWWEGNSPIEGALAIDPDGSNVNLSIDNLGVINGLSYNGPTVVGEPNGVNYNASGVQNVFLGPTDGPRTVVFRGIPLDPTPEGRIVWVGFHINLCDANGNSRSFDLYVSA